MHFYLREWSVLQALKEAKFKELTLTKNGPIDFAQSWAIHMKKSNSIYGEEKKGGSFTFLGP
jgi:hypothetical protein